MTEWRAWQEYLNVSFDAPLIVSKKIKVTQIKKLELTDFMADYAEELYNEKA